MKFQHIFLVFFLFISLKPDLTACSGTGEIALCNIIHNPDFVANGVVWIGEPLDSCQIYNSYAGNFTACLFVVKEILHGSINQTDTTYPNTDSLVWLIGGPSNLCYENANYTGSQHLFATRFQMHYAYDSNFKGYSTFSFIADYFEITDTMIGNFIHDFSYFDPLINLGPDTLLVDQLQNLVNNCINEIQVTNQKIEVFQKNNSAVFTINGDLSNYQVEIIDTNGTVVDNYESPQAPLHINTSLLPTGLYFVKTNRKFNLINRLIEATL